MKFREIAITAPLATALLCGAGWAQQAPDTPNPPETPPRSAKNPTKEKHWSGSLVDVSCMAKTLASGNAVTPQPAPAVPHLMFAAADPQAGQVPGQVPGGGMPGGMGPGQRGVDSGLPTQAPGPDSSADERARDNRIIKLDNAAKACTPSPSTQALGLATSDGQVMQFDPEGVTKAKEALKAVDVQPGKKVKAKVTGTLEDKNTVKVAEVEVKGKGK